MLGGSLRGGRILGQYPTDLSDESPLNIGRGRLLPTLPWEAVWNAVAQWMDVNEDSALDKIFPNRRIFSSSLFRKSDIFNEAHPNYSACSRRLTNSWTCEKLASSVSSPSILIGNSPSNSPGQAPSDIGKSPSGSQGKPTSGDPSHPSLMNQGIKSVTSWLVPILLLVLCLITAAGYYRRQLRTYIRSKLRFIHSNSEPKVIFMNAIDPCNVEVETVQTIYMFEKRPDYWSGYS